MGEATPLFGRIIPTVVSRRASRALGARPQALAGVGRIDDAYGDRILVFRRQKRSQSPLLEQLTLAALFYSMPAFRLRAFGQDVGLAGGLCDAVALPAREGELDRLGQVNLVADRHEDRLHAVFGAHHRADHTTTVVTEIGDRPSGLLRLLVGPEQERLRTADRRPIQDHTDVTGNPRCPRMRQALAVYENQIRIMFELAEGLDQRARFAERQEAGNVREGHLLFVNDGL